MSPSAPQTRRPRRRRIAWLVLGLTPLALLAATYAARAHILPPLARLLDVSARLQPADYALVLGGGTETRPFMAAELFRAGLVTRVLVSRVRPTVNAQDGLLPTEQEISERALEVRGVPQDAIVYLGENCNSTRDEAVALAAFLAEQPHATVLVVTNGYHTRRARWIFCRALGREAKRVRFVAAPSERFDETNWWKTREGFVMYANEFVKSAYYWGRY